MNSTLPSKNAIVVISIGRDHHLQWSLPYLKYYCEKHNIFLEVITKSPWEFKITNEYNYNTFQKYLVYEYFNQYDRILRLDSDIIINPNSPNFFNNPPGKIYVSFEDVGNRTSQRLQEIKNIQQELGSVEEWNKGYFNSGVVLCDREHKSIFEINIDTIYDINLGPFKEQTLLNWKARHKNFPIINLGPSFNFTRIFEEPPFNLDRKKEAHIIHYAGPQNGKISKMEEDFNYFKKYIT